jgi:hypothetical protein
MLYRLFRGVAGHDPAAVDDGQPVTQPLGLVEVMGGQQDRDAGALAQGCDRVEQVMADPGVQADCRLVEEQDPGCRQQGPDDLEPAPLSAAVSGDRAVEQAGQAHRGGQLG